MNAITRRAGILGGGQLARMLAEAGARLGLTPVVLAESASAPAAQVVAEHVIGGLSDEAALHRLFASVPLVVFENEFVDCALLARAAEGTGVRFAPSLATIELLQDKLSQKRVLDSVGAPTAGLLLPEPDEPSGSFVHRALERWNGAAVLKWARLGYDGKGVFIARPDEQSLANSIAFCDEARRRGLPLFAERHVVVTRELAVISVRSIRGETIAYPLVAFEQERSICKLVRGPAVGMGVDPELEARAQQIARRVGEAADLVGTFAIEFFETAAGDLVVNEIAPRVHNSGHYTQDACTTSQFENHWRAVLGLPLGDPQPRRAFAMLNFLGPAGAEMRDSEAPPPRPTTRGHVHWYCKEKVVPWRKLGHVNAAADDAGELQRIVDELRQIDEEWKAAVTAAARVRSSS